MQLAPGENKGEAAMPTQELLVTFLVTRERLEYFVVDHKRPV